ncbi:MAG: Asp-tRNA(Asn)/Glu-tRNA(Gln) amidotransferase subunit GatB [Candidatus Bathyarchaeia archaeon]
MSEEAAKIGLEVHCQLTALKTKLFCGCDADYREKPPNTVVCPACLGLPGALPVLNRRAVDFALMVGLALECEVPKVASFYRKNYYYPDLPKNFQISQYDRAGGIPIGTNGRLKFAAGKEPRTVTIRRIQLEEDPGKLHYAGTIDTSAFTLVDYNRSGVALLEIVTEPELNSPREARFFLQKLRSTLEHLGVSDGSLEGAMRCDANVSVAGGSKIEVKNISSFKEVERALTFEAMRQRDLVKRGGIVKAETRHWDELRRVSVALRTKEEEQDYRYFPEADLALVTIPEHKLEALRKALPELPDARKQRFTRQYQLPEYDAEFLTSDRSLADFFENTAAVYPKAKPIANWLMGDVLQCLYSLDVEISRCKMTPKHLAEMLTLIDQGTVSVKIAKKILWDIFKTGKTPSNIIREKGLVRIVDAEVLEELIGKVFAENEQAVRDALTDEKAVNYLVGKLMEATKGRADPALSNKLIRGRIEKLKGAPG